MLKELTARVVEGGSLSVEEASEAMREIVSGRMPPALVGAYLVALRLKGETVAEILGSALVVREGTTRIRTSRRGLLDTCGTGGDGSSSFNVSTAAALVVAGAGVSVAKHGNRSISSRCGSADLLEACGVPLDLGDEAVGATLDEAGICFLFAPALNGAMAAVASIRRDLGLRTLFNLLGPLANPAGAERQLLGVYEARWVEPIAEVLAGLGSERALVVHGFDGLTGAGFEDRARAGFEGLTGAGFEGLTGAALEGLDEISVSGPTKTAHLSDGRVTARTLTPESFGLRTHPPGSIRGGDPRENREQLDAMLAGEHGAVRDAVVANAGAALWIAGAAPDLEPGARLAEEVIDSGKAAAALEKLVAVSRRHRGGK